MAVVIPFPWPQLDGGTQTLSAGFRSGIVPSGWGMRGLIGNANIAAVMRQKVLFRKSIKSGVTLDPSTATNTWRFQFHTGPNGDTVRMRAVLAPAPIPGVGTINPVMTWTLTEVGVGDTAQDSIYHNHQVSGSTVNPDDFRYVRQTWSINADTTYRAQLNVDSSLRILGCTVWEMPAVTKLSTDVGIIDPTPYLEGEPIYDADANEIVSKIVTMWKGMGDQYVAWCRDADTFITQNSTTWKNVVDGGTSGWSATTPGFTVHHNYHGAYEGYNSGSSTEDIPVTLWAFLKTDDAAKAANVRFVDSSGTIGTLSSTSTTGEWQSSDVTWTADASVSTEKIDIEVSSTGSPAGTASVIAAGMYRHEA